MTAMASVHCRFTRCSRKFPLGTRYLRCTLVCTFVTVVTVLVFYIGPSENEPIELRETHVASVGEMAHTIQGESELKSHHHTHQMLQMPINHGLTQTCPALGEITGLVDDRQMDLKSEVPINKLEQVVFRNQTDLIRQGTANGNRQVQDLIRSADPSTHGSRLLTDRLSQHTVRCGDYLHLPGGHFRPATCAPRWKVAIVVPFRNRTFHLPIFLRYMIPLLQKQRLEFAIYIVNQENNVTFNRGMLMNVGFVEALNFSHWDCFVFHDVDLLPQSELNPYGCVDMPRHFVGGADNRNYTISYSSYFGGINGFTTAQYRQVNGFGNVYWGWCCQDDDLGLRVLAARLRKTRYKGQIAHYRAIRVHHNRPRILGSEEKLNRRYLKSSKTRMETDGLSNLRYKAPHVELHTLYTNISVDIRRIPVES